MDEVPALLRVEERVEAVREEVDEPAVLRRGWGESADGRAGDFAGAVEDDDGRQLVCAGALEESAVGVAQDCDLQPRLVREGAYLLVGRVSPRLGRVRVRADEVDAHVLRPEVVGQLLHLLRLFLRERAEQRRAEGQNHYVATEHLGSYLTAVGRAQLEVERRGRGARSGGHR